MNSRSEMIGYCTNVHAGMDLPAIRSNLSEYAVAVREILQASDPGNWQHLGVGLWIPDLASRELVGGQLDSFREFLAQHRLAAFTINGFPFDNFHGDHVKQRVYLPAWDDLRRMEYTQRLAVILAKLMPDDQSVGSISTLPLGWPSNPFANGAEISMERAGNNFRFLAEYLTKLEKECGKRIVVAIEPEPGCALDTIDDMIQFFESQLPDQQHRKYITACHDICHSAVMNESQKEVLQRYTQSGITIGKVQVSSAIVADWKSMNVADRESALDQLNDFAEDRYLHQTGQLDEQGRFELATDLPELINRTRQSKDLSELSRWVIHFHVPIFLQQFGLLSTSRDAVVECLQALSDPSVANNFTGHLEVETYAWTVLPAEMRARGLAQDIASELQWLTEQVGT